MGSASVARRASIGFAWNQAAQVLNFGLSFLASIVIARGLGATEYGIYATLLSFISLATLFSSLGFEQILNTYVPQMLGEADNGKVAYLTKRFLGLRLCIMTLVSLAMVTFSKPLASVMKNPDLQGYLKFAIFYLVFNNTSALLNMLLISQLRTKETSLIRVASSVANLALSYASLRLSYGIEGLIVILTLVSFLSLLGYLLFSRKQILSHSKPFDLFPLHRFGLTLWSIGFVNYALGKQSDILLMGFFLVSNRQIGFYALAFGLTEKLSILLTSGLVGVGLAAFSEIKAKQGPNGLAEAWRAVMAMVIALSFPIMVFFLTYAKPIILTLYSQEYLPSVVLFQVFAAFHLLMRLTGGGANSTVMYVMNKERTDFYLRLGAGVFNLALACVFIPRYGALGAITATGLAKLVVTVLEAVVARRYAPLRYPLGFVVKLVVSSTIALGISATVPGSSLFSLGAAAVVYGIAVVALLYVLKPLEERDKELLSQVDRRVYALLKVF